jgi:hypothetical protein
MPRVPGPLRTLLAAGLLALGMAGCGSSSSNQGALPTSSGGSSSTSAGSAGGAGVLTSEAQSAATGDIPDNQVFLTFDNAPAGYSMKYPEGWTQKGSGADVTFQSKDNIVHIVVASGPAPTAASVSAALTKEKASNPTLVFAPPTSIRLTSGPAIKATYNTLSAPNSVTGKRILLIVDRYEFAHGVKHAIVDLGTAKGVDNVDAYRMMINSFRWR